MIEGMKGNEKKWWNGRIKRRKRFTKEGKMKMNIKMSEEGKYRKYIAMKKYK